MICIYWLNHVLTDQWESRDAHGRDVSRKHIRACAMDFATMQRVRYVEIRSHDGFILETVSSGQVLDVK